MSRLNLKKATGSRVQIDLPVVIKTNIKKVGLS